jgi:hypothetical protein
MAILAVIAALTLINLVLWETFETIILPRRVPRRLRLTRFFYRWTWRLWSAVARRIRDGGAREEYLSFYGPLSLILLLGFWAVALIFGFALLHWGLGTDLAAPEGTPSFGATVYMSGVTFFTLGLGDIAPRDPLGRALAVLQAGTGFGFLALVVGYLPVLYQAFSRREVNISMLDGRAGSPSSAMELLRRLGRDHRAEALDQFLHDSERWSAELLESHLSYSQLAYFRSQHEKESWVAALTTILDTSALVLVGIEGVPAGPANLTFAMARHTAVDLAQVFNQPPEDPQPERLKAADLAQLRAGLAEAGLVLRSDKAADEELLHLRQMYEPYVTALSNYLFMALPPWIPSRESIDDWRTSAWESSPD